MVGVAARGVNTWQPGARGVVCAALAVFFAAAGVAHFTHTDAFAAIVPPPLPFEREIVLATGVMEFGFAVGLLVPKWRRVTGWLLAAYLLAVLPANVFMAREGIPLGALESRAALWGRVVAQFPLIGVVLWCCKSLRFFEASKQGRSL